MFSSRRKTSTPMTPLLVRCQFVVSGMYSSHTIRFTPNPLPPFPFPRPPRNRTPILALVVIKNAPHAPQHSGCHLCSHGPGSHAPPPLPILPSTCLYHQERVGPDTDVTSDLQDPADNLSLHVQHRTHSSRQQRPQLIADSS